MKEDLISRKALIAEIEKSMRDNPHSDIRIRQVHEHEHRHFLCLVTKQPVYDLETLEKDMIKAGRAIGYVEGFDDGYATGITQPI